MLSAAIVLALVSMVLVKPDKEYLAYMDYRTMGLLFCLMTVMAGFNRLGVFRAAGGKLLGRVSRAGCVAAVLVYLCFFFSMIITNDVALITFVPFGITVLKNGGHGGHGGARGPASNHWGESGQHDDTCWKSPESVSVFQGRDTGPGFCGPYDALYIGILCAAGNRSDHCGKIIQGT